MVLIGNDLFATKIDFAFSLDHMEVLMSLYQPLVSKKALNLYYTLLSFSWKSQTFETHHTLCEKMQLNIEEIELARKELEQMLLLRTMVAKHEKHNLYYYIVLKPKDFSQFLKHDLFSRLLLTITGSAYIRKLIHAQSCDEDWDQMEDVTSLMQMDFSVWTNEHENQHGTLVSEFVSNTSEDPYARYDILSYLMQDDPRQFKLPYGQISKDDISFINYCGQSFKIDHPNMVIMMNKHYNRAESKLNREGLQASCLLHVRKLKGSVDGFLGTMDDRSSKANSTGKYDKQPSLQGLDDATATQTSMICKNDPLARYSMPTLQFVLALQEDMILAQSEMDSFRRLQADHGFTTEVFNALLEMVWQTTNNFNSKYIDKMCVVWKRNKVDSLTKALQVKDSSFSGSAQAPSTAGPMRAKANNSNRTIEKMPEYKESSGQDFDIDYEELSSLLQSFEDQRKSWHKS